MTFDRLQGRSQNATWPFARRLSVLLASASIYFGWFRDYRCRNVPQACAIGQDVRVRAPYDATSKLHSTAV